MCFPKKIKQIQQLWYGKHKHQLLYIEYYRDQEITPP